MTRQKSMQSNIKARPIFPGLHSSKFSKAVTDALVYLIKTPTLI